MYVQLDGDVLQLGGELPVVYFTVTLVHYLCLLNAGLVHIAKSDQLDETQRAAGKVSHVQNVGSEHGRKWTSASAGNFHLGYCKLCFRVGGSSVCSLGG